jgi:hypothetical protein
MVCCCCLSQKVIRIYANFFCILSALLLIASIALIYLCISLSAIDYFKYFPLYIDFDHNEFSIIRVNDAVILVGLTVSGFSIFNALWACGVKLCKSKLCLCPWLLMTLVTIGGYGIAGAFMIMYGNQGKQYIESRCQIIENNQVDELWMMENQFFGFVKNLDDKLYQSVNQNMCSPQCPCF